MEIVNKQYGDREAAIIILILRMLPLKLRKGPVHKQITSLVQGMRHARVCLRTVQA